MSNKIPMSVVMITKNEEHDLPRALESVKDFAEIIIVDAFSEDGTIDIAKAYTDRIYQRVWPGFSIQKQRAMDYASYPWILMLDADEVVTVALRDEIRSVLQHPEYAGYELPRKNFFLGKCMAHSGFGKDYILRLFRKDSAKMEIREVHERVLVEGRIGKLQNGLEHYSHVDLGDYVTKTHAYADLAATQMFKEGRRVTGFTIFIKTVYAFIKIYILNQGFRDGTRGFILARLFSFSTFLKYAKLWEKWNGG